MDVCSDEAMDDELLAIAKKSIGAEHGSSEAHSCRLVGQTAAELHRDALAMARELNVFDPIERARDDGGRFATGATMNERIRWAAGR